MDYLYRKFTGIGQNVPLPLARYEYTRPWLVGTGLWAIDHMYDVSGNLVPFYVDVPRTLGIEASVMIRHKCIPMAGYVCSPSSNNAAPAGYPIYANLRVNLVGPTATSSQLPPLNWSQPSGVLFAERGTNIGGFAQHYATPSLSTRDVIQPGYYRIESYAATGAGDPGSPLDIDGLGELPDFSPPACDPNAQAAIHQFRAWVE